MGFWNYVGTQIHSGVSPVAWTDIDVSAIVGSNRAICLLSIVQNDGVVGAVAFRPNGEGNTTMITAYTGPHGVANVYPRLNLAISAMVVTDASGIFEWINGAARDNTVVLEGYIVPSQGPVQIDADFTLPTGGGWDNVDASPLLGSEHGLAIVRHKRIAGAGNYGFANRPEGDSTDYLGASFVTLGAQHGISANGAEVEVCCAITDDNGLYELSSTVAGQHHELHGYAGEVDAFIWEDEGIFSGVAVRNTWTAMDSKVARAGLAFIRVEYDHHDFAGQFFFVRRTGDDTRDWANILSGSITAGGPNKLFAVDGVGGILVVPLDAAGMFEYYAYASGVTASEWDVEILGYVSAPGAPPVVSLQRPTDTVSVRPHDIGFRITDEWGMDLTSIDFDAVSPIGVRHQAIIAGVIQAGWTGSVSASDSDKRVDVSLTDWPDDIASGHLWTFAIEAANIMGQAIV